MFKNKTTVRRVLGATIPAALLTASSVGCAGGPYDSPYPNNGYYNGAAPQIVPGAVMPPGSVLPPGATLPPGSVLPSNGAALPQGTFAPNGALAPQASVLPQQISPTVNQNLPYGYPIGTDLATVNAAVPAPSLSTPAPGLAPQYNGATPGIAPQYPAQAYTAGVPLNQLYHTKPLINLR